MKVKDWYESLSSKASASVAAPINNIKDWLDDKLAHKLQESFEGFFESYEREIQGYLDEPLKQALKSEHLSPEMRKMLEELRKPSKFAFAPILLILATLFIFPLISAVQSGISEQIKQESYKYTVPTLLGPSDAISAYWRNLITSDRFRDELKQHGFSNERIDVLEEVSKYIPAAPDLIRFAVRDVFDDKVVKKYGYDKGFDDATRSIGDRLQAAGMDKETLRLFWRAHWELPSIQLGFEMLHRGKISKDELKKLLQIADIAPNFINPIMDISYHPYTRVDVKRMYQAGVLTHDDVHRAYLDLGYDGDHADKMTAWTVQESVSVEKDLTKSEILKAYSVGRIRHGEALNSLQDLGYDKDEADIILSLAEYQAYQRATDKQTKLYADMYYHGIIGLDDFGKELDDLGLSEKEKSLLIAETDIRIQGKHKNPTKADLLKWYEDGHINKQDFMFEMRNLGYKDKYIELYIKK